MLIFFLPNVCQFATEEARDALLSEGFGDGVSVSMSEGYDYKFGILMDGNGATCSRTSVILRSQSALLRYASSYELFYTSALMPGEHFIAVSEDADVIDIVERERRNPGTYESVASGGENLPRKYCLAQLFLNTQAILSNYIPNYSRVITIHN